MLAQKTQGLRQAISKEEVRNTWDILSAILGHKYYHNHLNRFIFTANEANVSVIMMLIIVMEMFKVSTLRLKR